MSINHPNFGSIADNQVIIFDTTLRDGEQAPGFSMTADEKIRMATALAALGVDVMEAGFPAASPSDFESVRRIATSVTGPVIAALSRAAPSDIERSAEALKPAKRRRIHTFIATSELHMAQKLRMSPEQVIETIKGSVTLARNFTDDVEWSAEDATRTDLDFLCRAVETANGARGDERGRAHAPPEARSDAVSARVSAGSLSRLALRPAVARRSSTSILERWCSQCSVR